MSEVDQKRIARNTILLYIRMVLVALMGFWISREILDILQPIDNGIYSTIGDTVVMFSFLSNTMSTACQRFFSFEIAKKDSVSLRSTFSQCLVIFAIIVVILIALSETLGLWFLKNEMTLCGRDEAAYWVWQFSTVAFIFQVIRTPYLGMIIAHERMGIFASLSVFEVLGRFVVVFILRNAAYDKLVYYAALILAVQILTTAVCWLYCRIEFKECRFTTRFGRNSFGQLFRFTGWEMVGSVAGVCKMYGVNVLINPLFGPLYNTARGMAEKIYMTIVQLQTNFYMAVKPQIIKSYAVGEIKEMEDLLFKSTRITYYLLLVFVLPVFLETNTVLDMWLKDVPEHTVLFTKLLLINGLIDSFSTPLASAIQATGKNKWYQICMGSTLLAILPVSYVFCKYFGKDASWIFYISIVFSLAAQFVRAWFVKRQAGLDMMRFVSSVICPVVAVTVLSAVVPMIVQYMFGTSRTVIQSLTVIAVSICSCCFVSLFLGMTAGERRQLKKTAEKFKNKILCKQ